MITSSMCPINCFKQVFNCIADIKISILVAKKNTLKAAETKKIFVHILPWTQIRSHQFDVATLLKKNTWRSLRFWVIQTRQICKISPFPWVTNLMESMNKWPTTLSKLILTSDIANNILDHPQIRQKRKQRKHYKYEYKIASEKKVTKIENGTT